MERMEWQYEVFLGEKLGKCRGFILMNSARLVDTFTLLRLRFDGVLIEDWALTRSFIAPPACHGPGLPYISENSTLAVTDMLQDGNERGLILSQVVIMLTI